MAQIRLNRDRRLGVSLSLICRFGLTVKQGFVISSVFNKSLQYVYTSALFPFPKQALGHFGSRGFSVWGHEMSEI